MKREPIGRILARIDRNEERPLPASASAFDVTRKYRIVSGEDVDYADSLSLAKLTAGEWMMDRERVVHVVKQRGIPRRWFARLIDGDDGPDVELQELYADASPEDAGSRRRAALAKHIERERRRQRKRRSRRERIEQKKAQARADRWGASHSKAVVCLDNKKPFASGKDAAEWAGVSRRTLYVALRKGYRVAGFSFELAVNILKRSGEDGIATALVRAAQEAIRLSERASSLSKRQGELPGQAPAEAGGATTDAA